MPFLIAALFLGLIALLPIAVPWLQFVFTLALAHGLGAVGVALLLRAGLISLGHATYYAIGAYTTAYLSTHVGVTDFLALLGASIVMATLFGAAIGAFLIRYRSIFFAMLNLAVSMIVFAVLAKFYGLTGGTDGMRVAAPTVLGMQLDRAVFGSVLFYSLITILVAILLLAGRYLHSPLGQALSAIHTNEVRLEYLGVSVNRVLLSAYTISAALAGLGGAFGAMAIGHVVPEMAYWTASGHLVLVAVLGGIGGVVGPLMGSIFIELVHTFATGFASSAWNLIVGIALLLVVFFMPQGLYGLVSRIGSKRKATP